MVKKLEIAGLKFGRLTAVRYSGSDSHGSATWLFRCACGAEVVAAAKAVKFGTKKSCGCLFKEIAAARCAERARHGMTDTPTWRSWSRMLDRCTNKNHIKYERYGGRGVVVCDRWAVFENFLADMGLRPEGKTLDRWPNPDGNYEPQNCRWATPMQQRHNRSQILATNFDP